MTSIEWTDETWNPTRGCSRVSPGCDNCYAMGQARRQDKPGKSYHGLTIYRESGKRPGVDWSGRVRLVPEMLDAPLRWRKPRRVFVNSMSDLFHESLPDRAIDHVFAVMALADEHTFQVLTKRSGRLRRYFALDWNRPLGECVEARVGALVREIASARGERVDSPIWDVWWTWPLPNVWLGVSAEDQQRADERIPDLLATPAAVRFVSAEPLLGPIDLAPYLRWVPLATDARPPLSWVIVGGESGNKARPYDLAWPRSIIEQCRAAGVAVFHKQVGADPIDGAAGCSVWQSTKKGTAMADWPEELRVREFPEARA